MNTRHNQINQQAGFLLPAAIFLLVVLAGLGAYAVNITSVQQNAATQDIQGSRAYHAARAGVEWAVYQIMQTSPLHAIPSCPTTSTIALNAFNIAISCTSNDFTEQSGDHTIRVYEINSTATFGTVNTQNYIERRIDLTLSKCVGTNTTPNYLCQ